MNWQSKKLFLAALCAILIATAALWLVAMQVTESYRTEIDRSRIEADHISIAIEHTLLTKLQEIELIQQLAAEKIEPDLFKNKDATQSTDKLNEILSGFLPYSKISSTIGIIYSDNTLIAAASINNTSLENPPQFPQTNRPIEIQTSNDKKSIFVLQRAPNNNGGEIAFFSQIDNSALKKITSTFNINPHLSITILDKKLNILSKTFDTPVADHHLRTIKDFIQSTEKSSSFTNNTKSTSTQTNIRKIGETSLYVAILNNNPTYLSAWKKNTLIYILVCFLVIGLILQIIYFLWRSKRINQTLIQKENKLTASETRFRQMIEAMPIGLILARMPDYLIMYINQPAAQTLDMPQASALSKRAFDFYMNSSDFSSQIDRVNKLKTSQNIECILKQNTGKSFWGSVSISQVQVADAQALLIGIVDITARKKLEAELLHQATVDHLSGLFNRAHFISSTNKEIQRIHRHKKNASLLMLDIDHFKRVNDNYGHDAGDFVIQTIALTCKEVLRDIDIVGRLGGEEFAALLPETTVEEALIVAERLRKTIESIQIELKEGLTISITSSIGVTEVDDHDEIIDVALKRADLAMYASKNKGRNQVQSLKASR